MSNVTNAMNIMSQNIAYIFGYNQPTVVGDVTNSKIENVGNVIGKYNDDGTIEEEVLPLKDNVNITPMDI